MRHEDDASWTVLVNALQAIGTVEDREPHGLTITGADASPAVELVCTPTEWGAMVSTMWGAGAFEPAAEHVRQLVLRQPADHRYLVHDQYQLVPCQTAELPADPDLARMQELAAQYPNGIPGGHWSPHPSRDDPSE